MEGVYGVGDPDDFQSPFKADSNEQIVLLDYCNSQYLLIMAHKRVFLIQGSSKSQNERSTNWFLLFAIKNGDDSAFVASDHSSEFLVESH